MSGYSTPTTPTSSSAARTGSTCRSSSATIPSLSSKRRFGDSFEATDLEKLLAERGVGRLVVTGAQTDACIRATLHGAFVRGYDVTLVGDAHTTEDLSEYGAPPPDKVIAHTNLYWKYESAPGRKAGTVDSSDVNFAGDG